MTEITPFLIAFAKQVSAKELENSIKNTAQANIFFKFREDSHTPQETNKYCRVCCTNAKYKCSNCKRVGYCCAEHQREDWPEHKLNCKRMQ